VAIVVEGGGIFQIADVLRQDRLAILQQAERRLQLAADGEQVRRIGKAPWQRDGGSELSTSHCILSMTRSTGVASRRLAAR